LKSAKLLLLARVWSRAVIFAGRNAIVASAMAHNARDRTRLSLARGAAALGAALALAACATTGNQPAPDKEPPLYAPSQSNLTSLSEVIEKHPEDPQAYNMRGAVYGEAGRNDQAFADFNKAISLDPNYAQAYANRALIYRKTGQLDLALADDSKAIAIDASYVPAYLGRGIVYRQQGRPAQALGDFNKAIALKPDNAEAYYNRGLLYQSQHQHQFAIDDFSTALGLNRQQKAEPLVARALSYLASGNNKAAADDLDQAVQLEPRDLRAWTSRALAYERLGDKDKAAGSYAKALNIDDKYQPALTGFSRVGGKFGQSYPTF